MPEYNIGFVGTGQMATALVTGFHYSAGVHSNNLTGYDISQSSLSRFCVAAGGCKASSSNNEIVQNCDLVFLAVKPQIIPQIVNDLVPLDPSVTFISVMGGVTIDWLKEHLKTDQVIRAMPNTPCLIGEGATGISADPSVTEDTLQDVTKLFETVGSVFSLAERLIDVVTGLSGSGPAFVFQFIEALSDGAVHEGLPRDIALKLAAQTVAGAGKMVLESGEHPAVLKDKVASPAGTTIAGLKTLEDYGFRAAAINAVAAATKRSIELGRN